MSKISEYEKGQSIPVAFNTHIANNVYLFPTIQSKIEPEPNVADNDVIVPKKKEHKSKKKNRKANKDKKPTPTNKKKCDNNFQTVRKSSALNNPFVKFSFKKTGGWYYTKNC